MLTRLRVGRKEFTQGCFFRAGRGIHIRKIWCDRQNGHFRAAGLCQAARPGLSRFICLFNSNDQQDILDWLAQALDDRDEKIEELSRIIREFTRQQRDVLRIDGSDAIPVVVDNDPPERN